MLQYHTLGLLGVIASVAILSGWLFFGPVVPLDEGIVLVYPELINRGLLPNRDFASLYTPGNYWLVAAFFRLLGASVGTERAVGLIYVVALQYAIFCMARPIGLPAGFLLVLASNMALQIFPDPLAAYAWFGGLALAAWSVVVVTRPGQGSPASLLIGGLLYGFAVVFRHDLSVALTLMAVLAIGLTPCRLLLFACGASVGMAPLLVHMAAVGTGPFFDNLLWDVLRAAPGRQLPLRWESAPLWIVAASCLTPALVAMALWLRGALHADRLLLAIAGLCIGIAPQALQRADRWHLAYVGAITLPLAALAILKADAALGIGGYRWAMGLWRRSIPAKLATGAMLAAVVAFTTIQLVKQAGLAQACDGCVRNAGRVVRVKLDPAALQSIVDVVESRSRPGQSLFIGPADLARTNYTDSYLYHLFPTLRPAAFYIEMAAAVSDRPGGRTTDDLQRADFVILNHYYDRWDEKNASRLRGSTAPLDVLRSRFCSVLRAGPYQVLQPCG